MPCTLSPIGILRRYTHGLDVIITRDGISVREALAESGIPLELVALVIVNGIAREKQYVLEDGDKIQIMAILGGG